MNDTALKHNVKVDDEVWAILQARAVPFVDTTPNDVLRRTLLEAPARAVSPVPATADRRPGALMTGLNKGVLKASDVMVCVQSRLGRTFRATVTADGWIDVIEPAKGEFSKPSPALMACTGSQING